MHCRGGETNLWDSTLKLLLHSSLNVNWKGEYAVHTEVNLFCFCLGIEIMGFSTEVTLGGWILDCTYKPTLCHVWLSLKIILGLLQAFLEGCYACPHDSASASHFTRWDTNLAVIILRGVCLSDWPRWNTEHDGKYQNCDCFVFKNISSLDWHFCLCFFEGSGGE